MCLNKKQHQQHTPSTHDIEQQIDTKTTEKKKWPLSVISPLPVLHSNCLLRSTERTAERMVWFKHQKQKTVTPYNLILTPGVRVVWGSLDGHDQQSKNASVPRRHRSLWLRWSFDRERHYTTRRGGKKSGFHSHPGVSRMESAMECRRSQRFLRGENTVYDSYMTKGSHKPVLSCHAGHHTDPWVWGIIGRPEGRNDGVCKVLVQDRLHNLRHAKRTALFERFLC